MINDPPAPVEDTLAGQLRRLNLGRGSAAALPGHIFIFESSRLADPMAAVAALAPGGAVILRDYHNPRRAQLAAQLRRLCRARGLRLLIGGDGRLAAQIGADGLHLPEALIDHAMRWRRSRPHWLITAAAHSRPALIRAAARRVDAALLSPVFPTRSHPRRRCLGPLRFAGLVTGSPLPVYGLGGIGPSNLRRLKNSGAIGIAGISGYGAERHAHHKP